MRVLVTGGAGFIGSNIVDKLITLGNEVVIIDNLSTGKPENINSRAKHYKVDILSSQEVDNIFNFERPEYVIHHAAQIDVGKSIEDPLFDAQVNILGTINILKACQKYKVEKIVYSSSAAVYGIPEYLGVDELHKIEPISFYGISKYTPELYIKTFAHLYEIKYTILRYANVYGIRQDPKGEGGVISIFVDKFITDETPIIYGDGEQTRDFIYVDDIVNANIASLSKGDNEIYNISTNSPISINQLVNLMSSLTNKEVQPSYKEARVGDIKHSHLKNEKAINELGWKPQYELSNGLKETLNYYKEIYTKLNV